jgi:hypothetical protein
MSIDSLAGMFSQRSGANQSIASSVMSAIIGFIVQKMMGGGGSGGMGNMLAGLTGGGTGGSSGVGIGSILSGLGGLNKDHELARHVQQNTGIQDPEQARQYTQHGVDILNEQSKNNPRTAVNTWWFWEVEAISKVVAAVALEICLASEQSYLNDIPNVS